jgi:hypothetical protein
VATSPSRPPLAAGLLLLLLSACQSGPSPAPDADTARCESLFSAQDQAIAAAGVARSHPHRIDGFPYLRLTRLLASYRDAATDPARRDAWLTALAEADARARHSELVLLPPAARTELGIEDIAELQRATGACREQLLVRDRASPTRLAQLAERAVVADEYSVAARALGLYPVAALGLRAGVLRWHESVRARWQLPRDALAGGLPLVHYAPGAGHAPTGYPASPAAGACHSTRDAGPRSTAPHPSPTAIPA